MLGGGFVAGQVVLIGGDPGVGKSTLLLQALAQMSASHKAVYVSGEESAEQVALRAQRLALDSGRLELLAEIQLERILATLEKAKPEIAVIDSIQTLYSEQLTSAPGSVAQVRECVAQLARYAKAAARSSCWSATSPRKARSPARAWSSTSSTRCSTSKATRIRASA